MKTSLLVVLLAGLLATPGTGLLARTCAEYEAQAEAVRGMRDSAPADGVVLGLEGLDELRREAPDCKRAEALLLGSIGSNQHILGDNEQALQRFEGGLALAEDDDVLSILHRGAGVVLYDLDRLDRALQHYLDALAASDRIGDALEVARTASNIGNLYNSLGELDEALDYHQKALDRFEAAEWPLGIAGASVNVGSVWAKIAEGAAHAGDETEARRANERLLETNRRALSIFEELDNQRGVAYASNNIATALDRLGRTEEALAFHEQALDLRRQVGDRFGEIQSLSTLAESHITLGEHDRAEQLLDQADAILPEGNLSLGLELAERRVRLAEQRLDFRDALARQKEVTALRSAMTEEQGRVRVEALRESLGAEQREATIRSLQAEATVAELRAQRQRLVNQITVGVAVVLVVLIALLYSRYRTRARASAELNRAARTDPLTSLANRRSMHEQLDQAVKGAAERNERFSLIMADIDDFKLINDTRGHEAGDQALVHIATILNAELKGRDLVARWGGEEFLVYLPQTSLTDAQRVARLLMNALAAAPTEIKGEPHTLSMTFGVVEYRNGESLEACIRRADDAMYVGKHSGKNRIVACATEGPRLVTTGEDAYRNRPASTLA